MSTGSDDRVSRRRYVREQQARAEAEGLLENKSRELFVANKQLSEQAATLEQMVLERTAELQLALEKAEAASTARSRFIATMSHEIRTPLGGLVGMIDLLSTDETDPSKLELLNYAKTSGLSLNRIVNDVLDFSKMEAGLFVFEDESVDIRALVESVAALARTNLKGNERSIVSKIEDSVPKLFFGDATRIRQVISNLVSNAGRYSREGPIIIRAKASPHPKGVLLRVEVEDFGIGIDPQKIDSLFKDFSQISTSLTAAAQGTGLGLAISKRILEGCGGIIDVESTLGSGSTFWFELPVEVLATPQAVQTEEEPVITSSDKPMLDGKRILLAEDNIINQKLLLTYLKRMNIDADLAENGRIALEKFAPGKYDLILMDVAMPEMDGLDATRHIRAKWDAEDIPPVMVLTAHVMDAIQEEAAVVGIDTVLCKPIPFDDLKLAIETALLRKSKGTDSQPKRAESKTEVPEAPAFTKQISESFVKELLENFTVDDLAELVAKYVEEAQKLLANIVASYTSGDKETVVSQAHSLKGSSLQLGFSRISELVEEIEMKSTDISPEKMDKIAEELTQKLDEIAENL